MSSLFGIKAKVLVYIDNSNIFYEGQNYSAKIKKYRPKIRDVCCRIDIGKLVNKVCNGRRLLHGKLYGSEPPKLDTVWNAIRAKNIEVFHSKRSTWNSREKETDTKLTATAVADICTLKGEAGPDHERTMILLTGDRDMIPVVEQAVLHKWIVEVWSYKHSLAKEFHRLSQKVPAVKICMLDDVFSEVSYINFYYALLPGGYPRERCLVIRFTGADMKTCGVGPDGVRSRQALLKNTVEGCNSLFKVPTTARYYSEDSLDMVVVFCTKEANDNGVLYKFNDLYRDNVSNGGLQRALGRNTLTIMTLLNYMQELSLQDVSCVNEVPEEFTLDMDDPEYFDFILVESRKKARPSSERYSDQCENGYCCFHGKACHYTHTDRQKEFFKEQPNTKRRYLYKSVECNKAEQCKYRTKSYLCTFAHGMEEVRCLTCDQVGRHYTDECPLKP